MATRYFVIIRNAHENETTVECFFTVENPDCGEDKEMQGWNDDTDGVCPCLRQKLEEKLEQYCKEHTDEENGDITYRDEDYTHGYWIIEHSDFRICTPYNYEEIFLWDKPTVCMIKPAKRD